MLVRRRIEKAEERPAQPVMAPDQPQHQRGIVRVRKARVCLRHPHGKRFVPPTLRQPGALAGGRRPISRNALGERSAFRTIPRIAAGQHGLEARIGLSCIVKIGGQPKVCGFAKPQCLRELPGETLHPSTVIVERHRFAEGRRDAVVFGCGSGVIRPASAFGPLLRHEDRAFFTTSTVRKAEFKPAALGTSQFLQSFPSCLHCAHCGQAVLFLFLQRLLLHLAGRQRVEQPVD